MTPLSDDVLISHIIEQCERILKLTANIDFEEFRKNDVYQDAAVRNIEIIGEAAKNLSSSFNEESYGISVSEMVGMRNFLIHQYFRVDSRIVWNTCIRMNFSIGIEMC